MNPMTQFTIWCSDRIRSRSRAVWIAIATILFVCTWRGYVTFIKPSHWREKAIELGSIAPFRDGIYPNNSGNRVLFSRDTESGMGVYLWGENGGAKLLYEHEESSLSWTRFGLLGWSTDGNLLAYACQSGRRAGQIIIVNGLSGTTVFKLPVNGLIMGFAWLSPVRCTYMNDRGELYVFEEHNDGKWFQSKVLKNVADVPPNLSDGLAAGKTRMLYTLSDHEIAWVERGAIWSFDTAGSKLAKILWQTNTGIMDVSYCSITQKFIIEIGNENSQSLLEYSPWTGSMVSLGQLGDEYHPISFPRWINNGKQYGYFVKEEGNYTLYVHDDKTRETVQVFSKSGAWRYAAGERSVFICGSVSNEPPGLWEYDLADKSMSCIVPASPHPFIYVKNMPASWDSITNDLGIRLNYCVWSPVTLSSNKKYPLIIGQTPYNWMPFGEMAANEGFYFISIDRPKWFDKSLSDWGRDVKCIYDHLSGTLNVDTNSVYLFGRSAETRPMSEFLRENPNFSQGVMLFYPGILPDLSSGHFSKILIVDGAQQPHEKDRIAKYQNRALQLGIPVSVTFLNTPHRTVGVAMQRQWTEIFARFLCGI